MTSTLHVLGIPHTQTLPSFSHCAFTGKVLRFIPMMKEQGYPVIHYGVGSVNPGADAHVELYDAQLHHDLLGHDHSSPQKFVGDDANVANPAYVLFNARLARALKQAVQPEDFVCLPFGFAHYSGTRDHAGTNIETGIGYPHTCEQFRVFESNAWMSWQAGRAGITEHHFTRSPKAIGDPGSDYNWVIPNYFDVADWDLGPAPRTYLLFLGRIAEIKGMNVIREIARSRPDLDVLLCGQGDASPWLSKEIPNLRHVGVRTARERSEIVGGAIALLAPTKYIEPFGGVTVEANLCGTPAITTDFGVFPETIQNRVNGYRCHTLGDFLAAIEWAETLATSDHQRIRERAIGRYSLEAVGPQYTRIFEQLADLRGRGWYTLRSSIGPITKAVEI